MRHNHTGGPKPVNMFRAGEYGAEMLFAHQPQ